jgi:hypothetical protein
LMRFVAPRVIIVIEVRDIAIEMPNKIPIIIS